MPMQELSLNILDIAENCIKAKATLIEIIVKEDTVKNSLGITVRDNGSGMTADQLASVTDPFFTTRTTRPVGLGVSFFKMTAEMTGGDFSITSEENQGTTVVANYKSDHIDMLPMGDIIATIISLITVNPDIDFVYLNEVNDKNFTMDTREFREVLEGVPINSPDVLMYIKGYIEEHQAEIAN